MNCPLATNRFFMGTLHHVQRRSGRSEEGDWLPTVMAAFSPRVKNLVNRPHADQPQIFFHGRHADEINRGIVKKISS